MRKLLFNVVLLIVFSFIPGTAYGSVSAADVVSYDTVEMLVNKASEHLGTRYVWGASGPKGFDCSGFTSYVFRQVGIDIPRTSSAQSAKGRTVERDSMKPGDLIFFSSPKSGPKNVGHVGMVVDRNDSTNEIVFIHASCSRGITY